MKQVLVTGGAGYIGSHTIVELVSSGYDVVAIDNLANSSREALRRVEQITGQTIPFYKIDCRDQMALGKVFDAHSIDAVIHFAGLKSVGESVDEPLRYYGNNLDSTLVLCAIMQEKGVKQLIFSSSATVYGTPETLPLIESSRIGVGITNPYGQTKFMLEQILRDTQHANPDLSVTILRYFNPVGAHKSGLIGEAPNGPPNNLLPYISQVAVGQREKLRVFGHDYDTPDGTGVRDYIHVVDLAQGHVKALEHLQPGKVTTYNLGTGKGTSVLELLTAFEEACGKSIPYEIVARRPGDIAACYADCSLAQQELDWTTKKTIDDACRDTWHWQSENPTGYAAANI